MEKLLFFQIKSDMKKKIFVLVSFLFGFLFYQDSKHFNWFCGVFFFFFFFSNSSLLCIILDFALTSKSTNHVHSWLIGCNLSNDVMNYISAKIIFGGKLRKPFFCHIFGMERPILLCVKKACISLALDLKLA